MNNLKEVCNTELGRVHFFVTDDKEVYFSLADLCKLLNINHNEAVEKLKGNGIYKMSSANKKQSIKLFIVDKSLDTLIKLSSVSNADCIHEWLFKVAQTYHTSFGALKVDDLKDDEIANSVLKKLNELEVLCAVQKEKIEEDIYKVKLIDSIFATKAPYDFDSVCMIIKYKGLSTPTILAELRNAGILDSSNVPLQRYIDERYFRVIQIRSVTGDEEIVRTKVLIYKKGIRLVEDILKRKAGIKDGRISKS